jgi:Glycosyl transferases group 1
MVGVTADVSGPDARLSGPGTLVLLTNLGVHAQHDLANAFRDLGWEVVWWGHEDEGYFNVFVGGIQPPALVLYADTAGPVFPSLVHCPHPTAVLHTDSYRYTEARARRSLLFDVAASCHPGSPYQVFARTHRRSLLLPHAVVGRDFDSLPETRDLEVGWVGSTRAPFYRRRRDLLPLLADKFVMNDWSRRYPSSLIPGIYARSKIVVNISRDDWPSDAGTRVFEAMAAGALLVTQVPTELTELGFVEGRHFVGYAGDAEVSSLVAEWLGRNGAREVIADAARTRVLSSFTYANRANTLADIAIREGRGLVSSRSLDESAAAGLVFEQYLQERRWAALRSQGLSLISLARLRAARILWAAMVARSRHRPYRAPMLSTSPAEHGSFGHQDDG